MEMTQQTAESGVAAAAVLTPKNPPNPAENVRAWWKKARRLYPEATPQAWRFDWAAFLAYGAVLTGLVQSVGDRF
jgi:hypothetical protein